MAIDGMRPVQISAQLKIEPTKVYSALSYCRRQGMPVPDYQKGPRPPCRMARGYRRLKLAAEVGAALDERARERGLDAHELGSAVLERACAHPRIIDVLLGGGADAD
jgi:hypothetical protein